MSAINTYDDQKLTWGRDVEFASLLAHLSADPTHQQNMVNAQWTALRSGGRAGDVPAAIRTTWPTVWSTAAVRFGAHCVHWGCAWSQVQAVGPSLPGLCGGFPRPKAKRATEQSS